ncbi:GTPase activating protein (GAP), partial [Dipsacomyces acuminosporus]
SSYKQGSTGDLLSSPPDDVSTSALQPKSQGKPSLTVDTTLTRPAPALVVTNNPDKIEVAGKSGEDSPSATAPIASLRVTFQQCVIALGRIVNTDLLTRMDTFFDMYATSTPNMINRKEMFQLSEAILYIGHSEDVHAVADHSHGNRSDITTEEHLLRSVSEFLRRAVVYGEEQAKMPSPSAQNNKEAGGDEQRSDFNLPRNLFRVVILEDEMLEKFFSDIVPNSFKFTDGVELANPLRAISTHLPATPLTTRSAESAPARLFSGGRSLAEGMSSRVAQTIALGSQFVDHNVLAPIVRNAALSASTSPFSPSQAVFGDAQKRQPAVAASRFSISDELANAAQLSNAQPSSLGKEPSEQLADDMVHLSLQDNSADAGDGSASVVEEDSVAPEQEASHLADSGAQQGRWGNVPQEPPANMPLDPYENLMDEVDELLGEIVEKDDGENSGSVKNQALSRDEAIDSSRTKEGSADMDFDIDDDNDDDLSNLLKG